MLKKIIYFLVFIVPAYLWADCKVIVNNYSDTPLNAVVGFYNGESKSVKIVGTGGEVTQIKSDQQCSGVSMAGLGLMYINLTSGKSEGRWVYSPESKMIRAVGKSFSDSRGVVGIAPDGTKLILFHKYNPSDDKFEVSIERANRNISLQASSMD